MPASKNSLIANGYGIKTMLTKLGNYLGAFIAVKQTNKEHY